LLGNPSLVLRQFAASESDCQFSNGKMRISPFLNSTKGYGALAFLNRDSIEIMPLAYFGSGYPSSFYPPPPFWKKDCQGIFCFQKGGGAKDIRNIG